MGRTAALSLDILLLHVLVYLLAAVVSVPIARRLGLGSVLGYLIAGVVIGPTALNLIGDPTQVNQVAQFGVVILLFLIGMEVRPKILWGLRGAIFGMGGAQFVATTAAVAAVAMALGNDWRIAIAVGAIVSMSSDAIVLSMLEEKGFRKGPVGETAFSVLLFQDLAVILLFVVLPLLAPDPHAAAQAAGQHGTSSFATLPAWAQPIAVAAAVAAVVGGGKYLTRPVFRYIASADLREIFTAAALLLVVGVAALMTAVGLSPALGAFLAGVMLAESEFRKELESDIEPFRGILLGLFFLTIGAGLDVPLVLREPLTVLGVVALIMVGKAVVMAIVARVGRLSMRDAIGAGVALSQAGEFAFVLIGFTLGAQVLPAEMARLLTAAVAVSMLLTPLAFLGYERALRLFEPKPEDRAADTQFDEGAQVILAGFGRFGQIAGRLLQANDYVVSTMDSSLKQIDLLRKFDRPVNYGDASRLDLLHAAGAAKAKVLIVAIDDREKALQLVETAKQSFPHLYVLARAYDRGHAYDLLGKGADFVERETYEASLAVGREALKRLGMAPYRADRASDIFRRYDLKQFYKMRQFWDLDDENYIQAARQSRETLERLLAADLATLDDSLAAEEAARAPQPLETFAGAG